MIRSPADLVSAKRSYAKAGFVYKGLRWTPEGIVAHIWEKKPKKTRRTR